MVPATTSSLTLDQARTQPDITLPAPDPAPPAHGAAEVRPRELLVNVLPTGPAPPLPRRKYIMTS